MQCNCGLTGVVTGVTAGTAIIRYAVTNVCGTDTATRTIIINVLPLVPVISTQAPSTACTGTMYQNFGTATPPQAGTTYNWTAINATVWAQGTGHQYSLISFTETGYCLCNIEHNNIQLHGVPANYSSYCYCRCGRCAGSTGCSYFNNHFVCTPANEDSYQWGYDDAIPWTQPFLRARSTRTI